MKTRVIFFQTVFLFIVMVLFCNPELHGMDIIRDGRVRSIVVLPDDPTSVETHGGKLLCEYLSKMAVSGKNYFLKA